MKAYCKGCHKELIKGESHSCKNSKSFAEQIFLSSFYFRDKEGRFCK